MRGIQINNYFNNHITLNGKKVNQETQPLIQTIRPKPISHFIHQADTQLNQNRSPPSKSAQLPPKKRTNTVVELKKHIPSKRSLSTERLRNANSAKKREQIGSDDSLKEDEPLANVSTRKLKPSLSRGGLGKRSKSTIIKTGNLEVPRETTKKDEKKTTSNQTVESFKPKAKRKKSNKLVEPSKESRMFTKPLTLKKESLVGVNKDFKKLTIKLDKGEEKKSARSHQVQVNSKPVVSSKGKMAKPISARQKKCKKSRFIEQLKQKYENQTILEDSISHRLKDNEEQVDHQFLSVMNSLQKVLNSVGSKQKLKKELELINQKLKEFKLEEQNDQKEEGEQNTKIKQYEGFGTPVENIEQWKQEKKIVEFNQREMGKMGKDDQEQEQESEEEQYEMKQKMEFPENQSEFNNFKERENPLLGKRNGDFIFGQDRIESVKENDERREQIELLKRFKNESTKMMEKVGINQLPKPIVVNKQQTVKQKDNNLDEQFVIEPVQFRVSPQRIEMSQKPKGIARAQDGLRQEMMINNVSSFSSSSNGMVGQFEQKYPVFNVKSPRFDEVQLLGMISLKQQFVSSKHDKMSELVRRMFEKQLVSPKSYEGQIRSLDKKYQEENRALESLKKQAEQMSSMLSEIKKDKEEIQNIDQLIRNEQWSEAQKLVYNPGLKLDNKNVGKEQNAWKKVENWGSEQGWERVHIKQSDIANNEFVDVQSLNRGRKKAESKIDIDDQCGGTEESVELQEPKHTQSEEEYIYYNEENDTEEEGGLLRLVEIPLEEKDGLMSPTLLPNADVFRIENEEGRQKSLEASIIDKNQSNASVNSSQSDRKGFTTNLYFIKQYCIALCEFVRDNDIFKAQFRLHISQPLVFSLPNLLKSLRGEDSSQFFYNKREGKSAISELVWNEFNQQYQSLKCNANKGKNGERYSMEKEQEVIFVRMIYDVLNQSLDHERPGALFGRALPWREDARHLKNLKQLSRSEGDNIEAYDLMFGVAIARIIQWGSCLCGFLPDTVELENTDIDQSYVTHIRQTRMAFLLEKMMAEEETLMTNFEMQEADIQFRLAGIVYEQLLLEVAEEMGSLFLQVSP